MMFNLYHVIIIFISLGAAFFSGLLGIGGGIIIFPAFLYLLPFLGFSALSVNSITGVAAAQSFAGILFAFLSHRKHGTVNIKLIKTVLPSGILGALSGSISAKFLSELNLLFMYLFLLIIATILILIPKKDCTNKDGSCRLERPIVTNILILSGTFVSGALGFAGAVTFIPVLNYFCKAPIKVAISTTTLVVLIVTVFILVGKASVNLVQYDLLPFILIGAFFGANLGAMVNKRLPSYVLRIILLLVVLTIGTRIFMTILQYYK